MYGRFWRTAPALLSPCVGQSALASERPVIPATGCFSPVRRMVPAAWCDAADGQMEDSVDAGETGRRHREGHTDVPTTDTANLSKDQPVTPHPFDIDDFLAGR